jgi:DNA topoisomerase VI B subunit
MRKRTQLVGFEFGYWKHTQYTAEFMDNALDAIESFQWNELQKDTSKIAFSLDQELTLRNLSILQDGMDEAEKKPLNHEAKSVLMQEMGIRPAEILEENIIISEDKETESGEIVDKAELEVEEEVLRIIEDMNEIIKPVESIIDTEPLVIIRLRESEAPSFLTSELSQKNVMSYSFEIFDNGIGMGKNDLRKFGKYLASSKSFELKQTRGSQGFGAPSAFSDSQNTTGKPIIAVSKSSDNIYATVSEFFTTSKNEKRYLVHPTEVDSPFLHGTYIKLNYLNTKYKRGSADIYIRQTALMNPHITIIYIDPYGEELKFERLVSSFPREPKYAKPHPSSTNIGDLQDLVAKSENLTVSAFLQDNFVRVSSNTAKKIIKSAQRSLEDELNLLILNSGFIQKNEKKEQDILFLTFEKRIYGKSTKPREKLIIYKIESIDLIEKYWDKISDYNQFNKDLEKIQEQIKKYSDRIEKAETKKDQKKIEQNVDKLLIDIKAINKEKQKIKNDLDKLIESNKHNLVELKKAISRSELEDLVEEVQISKSKPSELTNKQFNSLFHAFKSIKYMAPPTDTAIPVGDNILENTLIKEIGLKISEATEDFEEPVEELIQLAKQVHLKDDKQLSKQELIELNLQIMDALNFNEISYDREKLKHSIQNVLDLSKSTSLKSYEQIFEYFTDNYSRDDDFVSAETRPPTSGKGLAYVVEAVLAYCNDPKKLETPKRSSDVLFRYVNRTPKLRDNADCAITKAVQTVNWKNYKLDIYDNNLPKGPLLLLINVSGPYVHLMFKSQSKNALADDPELIKEIKYCLEAIGRRLRVYLNRKATLRKKERRASYIEKYIPTFVESIYTIATQGDSKYKDKISITELETLMINAIGAKMAPTEAPKIESEQHIKKLKETETIAKSKEESISKKELLSPKTLKNMTKGELMEYCEEKNIELSSNLKKDEMIDIIQESLLHERAPIKETSEIVKEPSQEAPLIEQNKIVTVSIKKEPKVTEKKTTQTQLPIITTDKILKYLSNEWQPITSLIFNMKIKDMMDARFLQLKLKELERKGIVIVEIRKGKKHWKLK